jgi:hypothetical protein
MCALEYYDGVDETADNPMLKKVESGMVNRRYQCDPVRFSRCQGPSDATPDRDEGHYRGSNNGLENGDYYRTAISFPDRAEGWPLPHRGDLTVFVHVAPGKETLEC